jgi:hypothetical protein
MRLKSLTANNRKTRPSQYLRRKFSEADSVRLLDQHAPRWPEQLRDYHVIDRILKGLRFPRTAKARP